MVNPISRKGAEEARNQLPDLLEAAEKGHSTITAFRHSCIGIGWTRRTSIRPLKTPTQALEKHFCLGQTQLSALIPGMRLNSRMLLVMTISPSLRA